jgi:glutathione S-transferase
MDRIRLFSGPLSMFGAKAQIACLEKGLDVETVMVPFGMKELYQPKHPEVLRINPKRQVPVLIHGDVEIFDSTQIFEYLEDLKPQPALWPEDVAARARARLLEHKSDEVYFPPVIRLMGLQDNRRIQRPRRRARSPSPITTTWSASSAIASTSPARTRSPTSPSTWPRSSAPAWARR